MALFNIICVHLEVIVFLEYSIRINSAIYHHGTLIYQWYCIIEHVAEFLENLEEMSTCYHYIDGSSNLQSHNSVLPVTKRIHFLWHNTVWYITTYFLMPQNL